MKRSKSIPILNIKLIIVAIYYTISVQQQNKYWENILKISEDQNNISETKRKFFDNWGL